MSYIFRPQQFQLKTKKKLLEPLTIQNNCEVTSSVIITAQQLKSWMKANLLCEALRAARLFEPDRNEEKWTNEHVYWEQRMSIFFLFSTRTNNIEVKTQIFPQRKQSNLGPLRKLSFYDWLVLILTSLHASVCLIAWSFVWDFKRIRWMSTLQITW